MAKLKEITLKMVVDNEGNVQSLDATTRAMKRAEKQVKKLNKETEESTSNLGKQSKATNLAGQSALEMSRIASDAAYGMRGMANNIGQVATMMGELSKQAPKGINAMGRLQFMGRELGAALMGPMGVIVAIQGLLSLLTIWESRTNKQAEAQKSLNEALQESIVSIDERRAKIEALISQMDDSDPLEIFDPEVARQAMKELEKEIPNFKKLQERFTDDEIAKKYTEYLENMKREGIEAKRVAKYREELNKIKAKGEDMSLVEAERWKELKNELIPEAQRALETYQFLRLKGEQLFGKQNGGKAKKRGYVVEFYGKPAGEILLEAKQFNDALIALQTDAVTEWEEKEKARIKEFYSGLMAESMEGTTISEEQIAQLQADELAALDIVEQQAIDKREMLWQDHLDWMAEKDAEFVKRQRETDEKALKLMMEDFNNRIEKQQFFTSAIGAIMANSIEFIGGLAEKNTKNEERLFKIQKQVAIATTIIDTIVAAQRAYTSQLNPLDPTSIVKAKIAAAVAITAGMARVAAIRAQKLPSKTTDSVSAEGTMPVTTTGFSNLSGGETPGSAVRVYVLEHDIRTTTDKVSKTKVRSRL